MAAMELDLAGGRMVNRVARSWKMRLCVLQSHSLPPRFPVPPAPLRARSVFPPSSLPRLPLTHAPYSSVSTCLSTCAHAIVLYRATE